jgi:hypothetical protein
VPLRKTLLAGAIFIFLGAYIYFVELPKGDKEKSQPVLSFKHEDVESMTLAYPGQEIQLKKDASGRWRMTHPLQVPADESTISGILSALGTSEVRRTVEEKAGPEELKNFGLDKPHVKVSIGLKRGGSLPSLLVGAKTPVGNSTYVKRETEPRVLLTNSSLSSSFEKKLYDFRDKKILEIKEEEIKQLTLKGTHGTLVLIKKGDEWFIDKPKSYRADLTEVQGMLASLSSMFARDFIEGSHLELKKYGLDPARLQIALDTGEKEGRREILFGSKRESKDEIYVTLGSGGTVYTVLENVLKRLDKSLATLRDKQILSFAHDKVTKLHIHRTSGEAIDMVKGPKGEWIEASKTEKVQQRVVADYVRALGSLRAKGFAEDEPKKTKRYGLESPILKVSLEENDKKNMMTLLVVQSREGYYAVQEGSPNVYVIDEPSFKQINKRRDEFLAEKTENTSPAVPKK